MESKQLNFLIFGLLAVVLETSAFPTGSPVSACSDLMPVHINGSLQTGASPYMIILNSTGYGSGAVRISITAVGPAVREFMAFMLQARNEKGQPEGHFAEVPQASKAMTCYKNEDTMTHTAAFIRQSMEVTWIPPTSNVGRIIITGSIAYNKEIYWSVQSAAVTSSGKPEGNIGRTNAAASCNVTYLHSFSLILLSAVCKLLNLF